MEKRTRVQSAIKAKLMELGAYIDEELPEYIMVMVGNKRSKAQMEEDLKLFLGSNSFHFANWLHQVLQKLQEVTVPNLDIKKSSASSSGKRKSTDELAKQKKKKSKSIAEVSGKKSDKRVKVTNDVESESKKETLKSCDNSSDQENIKSHAEPSLLEQEIQSKETEKSKKNIDQRLDTMEISIENIKKEKSPSVLDGEEEDFLNIKADLEGEDLMEGDMDMVEEPAEKELPKSLVTTKQESSDSERVKSIPKHRSSSPVIRRNDRKLDARLLLNRKTDARELLNRKAAARLAAHDNKQFIESTSKRDRELNPPCKHYDDKSYSDRHSSRWVTDSSSKSRKYDDDQDRSSIGRSMNSSVGLKRKITNELDDSSSREKISDRQNRGLGSTSAESVKKSKVVIVSQTVKEGLSRVQNNEPEETRKRTGVLSRVVPRRHEPEDVVETPIPSVIKITPRPRRPLSQQPNHTLILKAMADANKSMASVMSRNDSKQKNGSRLEGGIFTRTLREKNMIPPDKIAISITNNRFSNEDNSNKEEVQVEEAEKYVNNGTAPKSFDSESENASITSKVESLVSEPEEDKTGSEPTDMIGEWLKGVDEARLDEMYQSKELISEENNASYSKTEEGPQFVVTLNGLDPDLFFKDVKDEDLDDWHKPKEIETENVEDKSASALEQYPFVRKRPVSPIVIVKKTANNNNLVDVLEATKAKPIERCKYWPNCRTGDQCVYHHPITPCKTFPTCKFGEHCLFIHPQCKFNTACTRRGCPYSHTSSVLPVVPTVSRAVHACRFFPKCTNLNCPFFHPKTCKFGGYCTKKDCSFNHVEIASIDKLKWSREGSTT